MSEDILKYEENLKYEDKLKSTKSDQIHQTKNTKS